MDHGTGQLPCSGMHADSRCSGLGAEVQAEATLVTQYENAVESGVASLFDKSMAPLRLAPGVHARGAHTALLGAEILTSIPGGAK